MPSNKPSPQQKLPGRDDADGPSAFGDFAFLVVRDNRQVAAVQRLRGLKESGHLAASRGGVRKAPRRLDEPDHLVVAADGEVALASPLPVAHLAVPAPAPVQVQGHGVLQLPAGVVRLRDQRRRPQSVVHHVHLKDILQGISDLPSIRPIHMKVEAEDHVFEDDYIFGAVSNTTSVGGVLTLDANRVDLNDGLFELILIKSPKDIFELSECIRALSAQDYNSRMITFISSNEVRVSSAEPLDWTLDGECAPGVTDAVIRNLHSAVTLCCNAAV